MTILFQLYCIVVANSVLLLLNTRYLVGLFFIFSDSWTIAYFVFQVSPLSAFIIRTQCACVTCVHMSVTQKVIQVLKIAEIQ